MKIKLLLLSAALIVCTAQQANAKIWRVNNNGYSANFAQLQDANDANDVKDGDTIHLEGSSTAYNGAAISKKLIIIGPGYFLNSNPATAVNPFNATISSLTFNNTSDNSQLIGVYENSPFGILIYANHIIIKSCYLDNSISFSNNITDIIITENFFSAKNSSANILTPSPFGFPTDVIFNNNICQRKLVITDDSYIFQECNNNIFDVPSSSPSIRIFAGSFQNNILTNPNATVAINNGDVTNVDYNISASPNNQFGTSKHNIVVADTASLFVGGTSPDGKYQAKAGSPVIASGSDGTDRGIFGGGAPQNWYTLSGLASIPVIYSISSVGAGSNALPVTIKARTIK